METHIVSAFTLLHIPTIHYIHIIQLYNTTESGRSMVVGHVLTVHTCSFMYTNHIEHILAFLRPGEHSRHPDFHHASRGETFQSLPHTGIRRWTAEAEVKLWYHEISVPSNFHA